MLRIHFLFFFCAIFSLPEGFYDSRGVPVTPSSLDLAQLNERLGKQALLNIGYKDYNGDHASKF